MFIICLILLFSLSHSATSTDYAYVSTLNSEDFLLAAQVLAFRLKQFDDYPFVVIVTEDISNASMETLKGMGVQVLQLPKIDTPYKSDHKANKYQYTKINLWKLTEYKRLLHLDLDVLPIQPLKHVFKCGSFCASIRHSNMFNSGVFVLEPNMTVYEDMVDKVSVLESYDGGDQGFLNSYFSELKYASMFDDRGDQDKLANNALLHTLPAEYNYDVAMYYVNGKMLVKPNVVHYTFGPTKPWLWWTYPTFDLNWEWAKSRSSMEAAQLIGQHDIRLAFASLGIAVLLHGAYLLTHHYLHDYLKHENVHHYENNTISIVFFLFSLIISYECTPPQAHPIPAWLFFFGSTTMWQLLLCGVYRSVRLGLPASVHRSLQFAIASMGLSCLTWVAIYWVNTFHQRLLLTIIGVPLLSIVLCVLQNKLIIRREDEILSKYSMVKTNSNDKSMYIS